MRKLQTTLTRIFIVLDGISRKTRKIKRFFSPKTGGLQKKKVFIEIETDFSAKIGNLNAFSAQKQVVSEKTKRSLPKLRRIFWPKSGIQTLFQAESRHPLPNVGTQFPLGGLFSFFHQKSASKAPKTCDFAYFTGQCLLYRLYLHTLQAKYTPSPGYATEWLGCNMVTECNISTETTILISKYYKSSQRHSFIHLQAHLETVSYNLRLIKTMRKSNQHYKNSRNHSLIIDVYQQPTIQHITSTISSIY